MALRDIFTPRNSFSIVEPSQDNEIDISIAEISGASYTTTGTKDAGLAVGSHTALLPKLQATYMKLARYIQQDKKKQDDRKNKIRQEISGLESKNRSLELQINSEKDNLSHEESKIPPLIKEIDDIRNNPVIQKGNTIKGVVGLIFLLFLSVYLFIFYNSVAYSALFKDFTPNDNKIAESIFDAQALSLAYQKSPEALVLTLTITFLFFHLVSC
jgi:hypothetical protein